MLYSRGTRFDYSNDFLQNVVNLLIVADCRCAVLLSKLCLLLIDDAQCDVGVESS